MARKQGLTAGIRLPMRKFLIAFLIFLGIVFVLGRLSEVESMVTTLRNGDIRFIFLGILCLVIWLINVAASYRAALRVMGIDEPLINVIPLAAASYFTNIVAPAAGAGGAALLLSEARKRKFSTARAMVAYALMIEFEYIGLLAILAVGILVLIRRNNLNNPEITASVILIVLAAGLAFLLYLGMQSAYRLERALVWLTRLVNKIFRPFIHKNYLDEANAHEFAQDAAEGLKAVRKDPKRVIWPLLLALTNKSLLLAILFLMFLAFETPISIGTVIAAFGIASLFVIVSPTPSGLGVVEGALALALISMYVKPADATLITLAYRAITFWLPVLVGMVAFRWLSHKPSITNVDYNKRT
jgi:uncharacterized protein (TIRG00374 family)